MEFLVIYKIDNFFVINSFWRYLDELKKLSIEVTYSVGAYCWQCTQLKVNDASKNSMLL